MSDKLPNTSCHLLCIVNGPFASPRSRRPHLCHISLADKKTCVWNYLGSDRSSRLCIFAEHHPACIKAYIIYDICTLQRIPMWQWANTIGTHQLVIYNLFLVNLGLQLLENKRKCAGWMQYFSGKRIMLNHTPNESHAQLHVVLSNLLGVGNSSDDNFKTNDPCT